jgi:hypothetical protein
MKLSRADRRWDPELRLIPRLQQTIAGDRQTSSTLTEIEQISLMQGPHRLIRAPALQLHRHGRQQILSVVAPFLPPGARPALQLQIKVFCHGEDNSQWLAKASAVIGR